MKTSITRIAWNHSGSLLVLAALAMVYGVAASGAEAETDADKADACFPVLCVGSTEAYVTADAGFFNFRITNCECGLMEWVVEESCDWIIDVTPPEGALNGGEWVLVKVSYSYNSSCSSRSYDITIKAEGAAGSPAKLRVIQAGKTEPDFCIAPTSANVTAAAGIKTFEIWNWGCIDMTWLATPDCDWVTMLPPSGSLTAGERNAVRVQFKENKNCFGRRCNIVFSAPGTLSTKTYVLSQARGQSPTLDLLTTSKEITSATGAAVFEIANTGCVDMAWTAETAASWITSLLPSSGTLAAGAKTTVIAVYAENGGCAERTGDIVFTAPDAEDSTQTATLTQAMGGNPLLQVSPTGQTVGAKSGWTSFVVTNNGCGVMEWSASENCDWIAGVTPASGKLGTKQSASVTVVYVANELQTARSYGINVTAPAASGSPKTYTLRQVGSAVAILDVAPQALWVGADTGTTSFVISNAGQDSLSWSAAAECDWVKGLTPSTGSLVAGQSVTVQLTYDANESALSRNCAISVIAPFAEGSPATVTVNQAAGGMAVLSVSPANRAVAETAGSTTFNVQNTGSGVMNWSAASASEWVTGITPATGVLEFGESATIVATYNANALPTPRNALISVTAADTVGSPASVAISQAANETPVLALTPEAIDTNATAGMTSFNVINDGGGNMQWAASESCAWVDAVSPSSGTLASGQSITVMVYYGANKAAAARNCAISVKAPQASGGDKSLVLSQAAEEVAMLSVSAGQQTSVEAGSTLFTVSNTGTGALNWTAEAGCDWITAVNPDGGTLAAGESAGIEVAFGANAGADARTCAVTVTAANAQGSPATWNLEQVGTDEEPDLPCGCFNGAGDNGKSLIEQFLGDLALLGMSFLAVVGLSKMRRY